MSKSLLKGKIVHLVPATLKNRRTIFNWMAKSDITPQMFGLPTFPELEPPDWEAFQKDYTTNYFTNESPLQGRCFIIKKDRKHIGQINYNPIDAIQKLVELDVWLAKKAYTGKGYGTKAIQLLSNYLQYTFGCKLLFLQPSARNPTAIKAYQKLGFKIQEELPEGMEADYVDSVYMIKRIANK